MRIIFAGTPHFAIPTLEALINSRHDIGAVFTKQDQPQGRGQKLKMSPVKEMAVMHNMRIFQPISLKDEEIQNEIALLNADVFVDVAYGLLLPKKVLALPRFGCINIHPSLLPRWRGAAPIQRAIFAGDDKTGVTIMRMDEGLDTGDILLQQSVAIYDSDDAASLEKTLSFLGAKLLLFVLDKLESDDLFAQKQNDSLACYAAKLTKEEAKIDWQKSAREINLMVRAFNPWPVAYAFLEGQTVRIFETKVISEYVSKNVGTILKSDSDGIDVATTNGVVRILKMQFSGGKILSVRDILNSKKDLFSSGKRFQ